MITVFKQIKRDSKDVKRSYENSYFDGKERIYYQCVSIDENELESYKAKGFTRELPTRKAVKHVAVEADSQPSITQAE